MGMYEWVGGRRKGEEKWRDEGYVGSVVCI